jgi:hypothetical protein
MDNPYDTSTRFFPFWDRHDINQLIGIINLVEYIFDKNPNAETWCEIGVAAGESTSIFLGFSKIKTLHCIDPWVQIDDYFKEFSEVQMQSVPASFIKDESIFLKRLSTNKSAYERIKIHKDYSYNILPQFNTNFFDVIYIDGLHTYDAVTQDLNLSLTKLKPGGFLCGHDYNDNWLGVKHGVNDFLNSHVINNFLIFNDSSFLIQV